MAGQGPRDRCTVIVELFLRFLQFLDNNSGWQCPVSDTAATAGGSRCIDRFLLGIWANQQSHYQRRTWASRCLNFTFRRSYLAAFYDMTVDGMLYPTHDTHNGGSRACLFLLS